jgi:4-hydroxy-3-polyprenylbenzoate decarboxylase
VLIERRIAVIGASGIGIAVESVALSPPAPRCCPRYLLAAGSGSAGTQKKFAMKKIIVSISGATGAIYGLRLLQVLQGVNCVETHLVLSPAARRTIALETDYTVEHIEAMADHVYRSSDIAATISSGSFRCSGMIVAPCAMKTLSGIAPSYSDNLLLRVADVMFKDRRPLALLVRETPMHLGHLRLPRPGRRNGSHRYDPGDSLLPPTFDNPRYRRPDCQSFSRPTGS